MHAYLWERYYGVCLAKYQHEDVVNSVAFNPRDNEMLVTTSDDYEIKVTDPATNCETANREFPSNHLALGTGLAFVGEGEKAGNRTGWTGGRVSQTEKQSPTTAAPVCRTVIRLGLTLRESSITI